MQTLLVVLEQDLPVGLHHRGGAHRYCQVAEVEAFEGFEFAAVGLHPRVERWRRGSEAHEHEPVPFMGVNAPQAQLGFGYLVVAEVWGGDEGSVECVCPRVVGAHDRTLAAGAVGFAQPCAAVAAHIGVGVDGAVEGSCDQHAFAGDIDHPAVTGLERVGA